MSKRSIKTTGQSYTRYADNVMKPINWVIVFVEILFMAGVLRGPGLWIQIASFICMVVVIAAYLGIYVYWMLHAPNRLQSEGYNLEMNALSDSQDTIKVDNKETAIKISERR